MDNLQPLCSDCHEAKGVFERAVFHKQRGGRVADVVLTAGPSGSGKTTWVRRHMHADDIMIDLDALVAALTGQPWYDRPVGAWEFAIDVRDLIVLRLMRPVAVRCVWFIASEPDAKKRREFAALIRATRVVVLEVDRDECVRRIAGDTRRSSQLQHWASVVDQWWLEYRRNDGEEIVTG